MLCVFVCDASVAGIPLTFALFHVSGKIHAHAFVCVCVCVCVYIYTVSHKKTCHFVSDNNSGVYWLIFILFVPVETGRNTLQLTYLMA